MQSDGVKEARRVTLIGAGLNILLATLKATGGILFNSTALIADAVDSTGDLLSDAITYITVKVARKPADQSHPYGHGRVETVAALIIAMLLFGAAIGIATNAVKSISGGDHTPVAFPALIVALISIIVKEFLYRWTRKVALKMRSKALEANAHNHRSDAFSSIAVFIGLLTNYFIPGAWFMDAVASIFVTIFISRTAVIVLRDSAMELVDSAQDHELCTAIIETANMVHKVKNPHRCRSRRYGHVVVIDLDIEVHPETTVQEGHQLAHKVKDLVLEKFKEVADLQIHIEPEGSYLSGEIHVDPESETK